MVATAAGMFRRSRSGRKLGRNVAFIAPREDDHGFRIVPLHSSFGEQTMQRSPFQALLLEGIFIPLFVIASNFYLAIRENIEKEIRKTNAG